MAIQNVDSSLVDALRHRRQQLSQLIDAPVILWSGHSSSRNYPANLFPFRASSHFLYFAGIPLENAAIRLEAGQLALFMDDSTPDSALWHGQMPTRAEIAQMIGADADFSIAALESKTAGAATIAVQGATTRLLQSQLLQRQVAPANAPQELT